MVRKALCLFLFGLVFFIPGPLLSLGLGDIEVDSALNQPLKANIYLISARPEELEEMRVELAPADVFDRVGVPRPYFLTQLKFEPVSTSDGRTVIKVTSKDPVREPFLTFLVEVSWPKGRLLREYTVLLDPPEFAQEQAPQVAAPAIEEPEPVVEEVPVPQATATVEQETPAEPEEVMQEEPTAITEVPEEDIAATEAAPVEDIDQLRARMDQALGIDHSEPVVAEEETAEVMQELAADEEPTAEELEEAVVKETEDAATEEEVVVAEEDVMAEEVAATEEIPTDEIGTIVGDEYTTNKGDTLSEIAKATRGSESITVNQMMLAIQQANPDAFIQNNINLLKTVVVLRIPDEASEDYLTKEQATVEVSQQNSLWREYREQVSEKMVATNVDAPGLVEEKQDTSGELATEAEETLQETAQGPAEPKQELNIMASEETTEPTSTAATQVAGGEDIQKIQQELVLSKELIQSRQKENEELKSRVEALESMLQKKDKILNIQNQQLDQLKQQLSTETEKAEAAEKALQEQSTSEPAVETKQERPEPQVKAEEITPPKVEPLPDFEEPSLADQTILKPKLQPLPDWETLPDIEPVTEPTETEEVAEAQPQETPKEEPKQEPVAEVQQPEEAATGPETGLLASAMSSIKQNWTMFAAGLGVIAILLGLMSIRRRRSAQRIQTIGMGMPEQLDDDQFDDILDETIITPQDAPVKAAEPTEETFEPTPTADFDADSIAASPDTAADTSPDDILEEADVYISYGLHQQAQDLLTEAIANEPNRKDFKLKLAEVFYSQKDQQAFEQHAQSVKAELGESSSEWQNIVAMGKELSPANEDFAGGDTLESTAAVDSGLQSGTDQTLTDEDLEDTVVDNRDKNKDEGLEFDVDTVASDSFEDDPVASKIMAANENSDILEFEADDLVDQEDTVGMDTDIQATSTGLHEATGVHETSDMNELTEELDEVSMQTTMEDLKPLEMDDELSMDTMALDADDETNVGMDTATTPADPDSTAAYASADETEQFDAAGVDTEFLDPAEATVAQTATDLQELGPPSLIEEVGTKLDLAKAFVDMGDSDAAKETLLEVINEGDESQIKAAKDLMDKLGG